MEQASTAIAPTIDKNRIFRNVATAFKNEIYIIGDRKRAREIISSLRTVGARKVWLPDVRRLQKKLKPSAMSIILIEPMVGITRALKSLKNSKSLRRVPIHVVTGETCPSKVARSYYQLGASSVVAFPKEKTLFADILKKVDLQELNQDLRDPADIQLSKAIKARLVSVVDRLRQARIWCRDGVVYFIGTVPSLRKKEQIESILKEAPGVRKVLDTGFKLTSCEQTDKEIDLRLSALLRSIDGIPQETVSCSVSSGDAVLAGSVPNHRALKKLNKKLFSFFGLKSIKNFITVSEEKVKRDKSIAQRLKGKIKRLDIIGDIQITILDQHAILKGRVPQVSDRKKVGQLVSQDKEVTDVINHIDVAIAS